ncbi:MAG: alpha/beta hydrolase [Bacteroidetes bacterium]|nr:alpha/beta hydrolase [Bacteroidota bacterium]
MIIQSPNVVLQGLHGRPFIADITYRLDGHKKPVVIFSHGYVGFKDWGPFNAMAHALAEMGLVVVKFNFSHNGTTVDDPYNFADLEAFGNDNFLIELDDLKVVIDWVCSDDFPAIDDTDALQLSLLGHSRGGGITILKAREDVRVKKLVTWNSVNEFGKFWTAERFEQIKRDGIIYIPNSRTKQHMPIKWQMYESYFAHKDRLYIPDAVREIDKPFLIIHGSKDETVPVAYAEEMHGWNPKTKLLLIENGGHTFGGKHPWTEDELPADLKEVVHATGRFLLKNH